MTVKYKRIDTVFLEVNDFVGSIEWFQKNFGFDVAWRDDDGGYAALIIGETPLTLTRVAADKKINTTDQALFNLFVSNIEAAHQELASNGVDLDDIVDYGGVQGFEFRDPSGNHLSVVTWQEK